MMNSRLMTDAEMDKAIYLVEVKKVKKKYVAQRFGVSPATMQRLLKSHKPGEEDNG